MRIVYLHAIRDIYVFMLPYSLLLLLFIYSFILLFLLCTLGLILFFGRPTAHERSLKIVNGTNYFLHLNSHDSGLTTSISRESPRSVGESSEWHCYVLLLN